MLVFTSLAGQRAKNQLLYLNSTHLIRFLNNFNKKLQNAYCNVKDENQKNEIIDHMGSTYYIMNKLQQI